MCGIRKKLLLPHSDSLIDSSTLFIRFFAVSRISIYYHLKMIFFNYCELRLPYLPILSISYTSQNIFVYIWLLYLLGFSYFISTSLNIGSLIPCLSDQNLSITKVIMKYIQWNNIYVLEENAESWPFCHMILKRWCGSNSLVYLEFRQDRVTNY